MQRRLRRLVHLLVGAILTSRPVTVFHRAVYRASGGRLLASGLGLPMVLMTTTGRRTGRARTAPLTGFLDGPAVVVVASNGGSHRDPAWLVNLREDPRATVQLRGRTWPVRAREASQQELDRLWPIIVGGFGGYATYRTRTDRPIPLVILEPDGADKAPEPDEPPASVGSATASCAGSA